MSLSRLAAVGLLAGLALTGCSTYVNIPAQQADMARHSPDQGTVREVEIAALRAVLADRAAAGRAQIVLPEGSTPTTYELVAAGVGQGVVYATDGSKPGQYVLEVRSVMVRGGSSTVNVIRPAVAEQPEGLRQLVTVDLGWDPVNGWRAERLRAWRVPLDEALRAAIPATQPSR